MTAEAGPRPRRQMSIHRKRHPAGPRVHDIVPKARASVSQNGREFLLPIPFGRMPVFEIVNPIRDGLEAAFLPGPTRRFQWFGIDIRISGSMEQCDRNARISHSGDVLRRAETDHTAEASLLRKLERQKVTRILSDEQWTWLNRKALLMLNKVGCCPDIRDASVIHGKPGVPGTGQQRKQLCKMGRLIA